MSDVFKWFNLMSFRVLDVVTSVIKWDIRNYLNVSFLAACSSISYLKKITLYFIPCDLSFLVDQLKY